MDKFGEAVIGAVLIGLFVITSGPAFADWKEDCAATIKKLEERAENLPGVKKSRIAGLLNLAEQAIKKSNQKDCEKKTAKADRKLTAWGE